ncbi:NAD(P)/FAD-dependent oxidoreductase [Alicyclobacillus sp. SO9]|uniref:NAD(P)/FAD-dependent oxidoreductase n=1 Tax=Alicyclobacillus sp. SO9 TaxID=2665646 RepID=UPI0018E6FECA|nr:NAD(P)-binding protein [Alicyclobacillus sp. SO9]QQE80132.1 NAD(P)-binding protein [Alicyclobacillus sp. SO9]
MKVAVMGAGLSGLSCAIELERNGIRPAVFEKRSSVGNRFVNAELLVSIFSRPITDEISYLAEKHHLYLSPASNVKSLEINSPNQQAVIEGHLGFTTIRGRHQDSWEQQLVNQLNTPIHYDSNVSYEQLLREYTHVVVATGDAAYTQEISQFRVGSRAALKGVTVEGEFSRSKVACWFNCDFAPGGYGYFIPYSKKEANVVLAIPQPPSDKSQSGSLPHDLFRIEEDRWDLFFESVRKQLNQKLKVTDGFSVSNYIMGICETPRVGNTFFTGNCFGTLMPLLGFGQFPSVLSGIYAADDICGISHYTETTRALRTSFEQSLVLRRFMERLKNDDFDVIVSKMNGFWGQKLLASHKDVLKWIAYALRIWMAGSRLTP